MNQRHGFTLLELLLVIGLLTIFIAFGAVFSTEILKLQELETTIERVRSQVITAQNDALTGSYATSWGIAFVPGSLIRFQGSSFTSRNTAFDIITLIPNGMSVSGTTEIVFQYPSGLPLAAATTTFQVDNRTDTLIVNKAGTIDIQ